MAPWNRGALLPNNKELFCFIEISSSDELDIEIRYNAAGSLVPTPVWRQFSSLFAGSTASKLLCYQPRSADTNCEQGILPTLLHNLKLFGHRDEGT